MNVKDVRMNEMNDFNEMNEMNDMITCIHVFIGRKLMCSFFNENIVIVNSWV